MIIEGKYKIWYQTIDEDGNVTGTGVYHKDYIYLGTADRIARQIFGGVPGIRYRVSIRNPFQKYYSTVECKLCDREFEAEQTASGFDIAASIFAYDYEPDERTEWRATRHDVFRHVCPECFKRFTDLVDTIKKEHSNGL